MQEKTFLAWTLLSVQEVSTVSRSPQIDFNNIRAQLEKIASLHADGRLLFLSISNIRIKGGFASLNPSGLTDDTLQDVAVLAKVFIRCQNMLRSHFFWNIGHVDEVLLDNTDVG